MPLTVALVDDDAAIRERVRQALAREDDIELMGSFADGRQALAFLASRAPDVLLVDLGLPDLPGLAVITYCAQRHPGTDIMVLTIFGDAANVLQCIKAGASGYLLKDSLSDEIVQPIRQLRDGGAPMTPSIARQLLHHVRPATGPGPAPMPTFVEFTLTPTEKTVLNLIARGFKYAEIAKLNGVSVHTVHSHIKNIYAKLSVKSRSEAVFEASRIGLLEGVMGADKPRTRALARLGQRCIDAGLRGPGHRGAGSNAHRQRLRLCAACGCRALRRRAGCVALPLGPGPRRQERAGTLHDSFRGGGSSR